MSYHIQRSAYRGLDLAASDAQDAVTLARQVASSGQPDASADALVSGLAAKAQQAGVLDQNESLLLSKSYGAFKSGNPTSKDLADLGATVGAVGGAGACVASGVAAPAAPLCGLVGGYIGGIVGGLFGSEPAPDNSAYYAWLADANQRVAKMQAQLKPKIFGNTAREALMSVLVKESVFGNTSTPPAITLTADEAKTLPAPPFPPQTLTDSFNRSRWPNIPLFIVRAQPPAGSGVQAIWAADAINQANDAKVDAWARDVQAKRRKIASDRLNALIVQARLEHEAALLKEVEKSAFDLNNTWRKKCLSPACVNQVQGLTLELARGVSDAWHLPSAVGGANQEMLVRNSIEPKLVSAVTQGLNDAKQDAGLAKQAAAQIQANDAAEGQATTLRRAIVAAGVLSVVGIAAALIYSSGKHA